MIYLPIGLLAYVLSGFSLAIDKGLVRNSIRNPLVMTFYIGIFNLLLLVAVPFGFELPNLEIGMGLGKLCKTWISKKFSKTSVRRL